MAKKPIPLVDLKSVEPSEQKAVMHNGCVVPMPEPVEVPESLASRGQPERISIYRNAEGEAVFAIMRWPVGSADKATLPVIWDGKKFRNLGYSAIKPLYNSDIIAQNTAAPVLVVEGEKTAEEGARYLPDGWLITTWAGGTGAVDKTDWSLLKDRRVVIWPDNDEPGIKAAEKIKEKLNQCAIIRPSKNYPPKWDLADELPTLVTAGMVQANMMNALETLSREEVVSVIPDEEDDIEVADIDEHVDWKPLGYDDKYYYIMPSATRVILKMTARELMSAAGCLQIVNDFDYWREYYPPKKGSGAEADWTSAGASVMRACTRVGPYDPTRVCGRGVWFEEDNNRVVANTGDMLLVDGKPVNPVSLKGWNIYNTSRGLFPFGFNPTKEASDADGRLIVELCNMARWDKDVFGDLLAGYIATAVICGGLRWRTHIWVTGNSGSGKSTVINNIVTPCVGGIALYPLGETTESGIRQTIGNDALPVIFDEMEGTDQARGNNGDARRQAIIGLMRMASSEGRGRIMKGSAAHQAVSFTMRSSFLVASIGMSLKEAPDLTRTMVLSLRPLPMDATESEKAQATVQWKEMNRLSAKIPDDMPERLFARMTRLLPIVRRNADTFREIIAERLGNRRTGDQIGTLLAGRCALTSQRVMTPQECEEYLSRFQWEDVVASPSDREDKALIRHLRQSIVKVKDKNGSWEERSIGELIEIMMMVSHDTRISFDEARRVLLRVGIAFTPDRETTLVAQDSKELKLMMKDSTNPTDWYSVVSRAPGAKKTRVPHLFGGYRSMAVSMPVECWS